MKNIVCPICNSKKTKKLINTPNLKVFQCNMCKTSFVPKASITHNPKKDYVDVYSQKEYIAYYKTFRTKIFKQNWKTITSIIPEGKAVDFGASFGWFITCAPKSWNVIGIDQSKKMSSYARSKRIPVLTGNENLLKKKIAQFDLITLHNVFEHLPNPRYSLKIFHKALKTDGLLVIAVPNKDGLVNKLSYLLSLFGINRPVYTLFQVGNPSPHWFYYNAKTVEYILHLEGFKTILVQKQPIIDIDNFDKRLAIEKKTNFIIQSIIKIGVYTAYHLSVLFNLHDEIIIYAVKTDKK